MIDPGDGEEVIIDAEEVEEWLIEQEDGHYADTADECCNEL